MSDNLIIIDTDPGVDDALAILMAISRETRHLANVLAITAVRGNIDSVDQICLNALRVLQVAERLDVRKSIKKWAQATSIYRSIICSYVLAFVKFCQAGPGSES